MREFQKQAMMNHLIYEDILVRQSGMDYSAGIRFQKFLSTWKKQDYSPRIIKWEKLIRSKEENTGVDQPSTYKLPQMIALWGFIIRRPKSWPWKWGFL